jgi:hypothetical protein
MKPTELAQLRKLTRAGTERPLNAADFRLLLRIHFALREHEISGGATVHVERTPLEQDPFNQTGRTETA